MTLLADVVAASKEVAETSSRSRKIAILAELLGTARARARCRSPSASSRAFRGRDGSASATRRSTASSARRRPSRRSTIDELDRAITRGPGDDRQRLGGASASGSSASCSAARPRRRPSFVRRLFTGELRQGALAGLMVDAVAKAAGVPRRARAPRADALGRPHAHGRDRADRGRGGAARRRLRALPADPPDARLDRRERRPTRSRASSARRSSGSSTASASRSIAAATRCASTRATSTRSRTRCPGSSTAVRELPVRAGGARRRGAVDGRGRPGRLPGHRRRRSTARRRRRAS